MEQITFTPDLNLLDMQTMFETHGHEIRIVGGAVRDLVLGEEPKDIDICTTATPDEMIEIAAGFEERCHIVPTGLQHGTVTFVFKDGSTYEVTTLRVDTDTDGRHATVQYTTSFEEDAARRDLTINAMSLELDGTLHDYFGGRRDLASNHVRFVGSCETRIREDYLRILRYFRFAARFNSSMTFEDLETIRKWSSGLSIISRERIWSEMSRILAADAEARIRVLDAMSTYGVLDAIDLKKRYQHAHNIIENADCPVTALACYLTTDAEDFGYSWKMSVPEIFKLAWISKRKLDVPFLHDIEDMLVAGKPRNWVVSWTKLHGDARCIFHAETWKIPTFPVKGQDLLDAGHMRPGKEVGQALSRMRAKWIESRFEKSKEALMRSEGVTGGRFVG